MLQGEDRNHVVVILRGFSKIIHEDTLGAKMVLAIRGQGDIVGELAGLLNRPRAATVRACGPASVRMMGFSAFNSFLSGHPDASLALARATAFKLDSSDRRLIDAGVRRALTRIARLLEDLAGRYGEPCEGGVVDIAVDLPQADLAAMAGMSPSSVYRQICLLRDTGVISNRYARIRVLNHDRLRALALAA